MRRVIRIFAGLVLLLALVALGLQFRFSTGGTLPPRPAESLRVASFNVHYIMLGRAEGPWSRGDWEARRGALDAAFKALDADLVAFQEMESFAGGSDGSVNLARDWLLQNNTGYALAAHGDWREFPVTQPIFYRRDALSLRDQGWFFFSKTPDVIDSRTFDGSWPAFCSWAEFEDGEGRRFTVFNMHFEYRSRSNRRLSATLVAERMAPRIEAGETVLLLGDINALRGSRTMALLEAAGLRFPRVAGATYHLGRGLHLFGAIDHIAATPDVAFASAPKAVQRRYGGKWPSDHHPVVADIRLP